MALCPPYLRRSRLASLQYKETVIMEAGGWSHSKAAQRHIQLHDAAWKEAAERLSAVKPAVI